MNGFAAVSPTCDATEATTPAVGAVTTAFARLFWAVSTPRPRCRRSSASSRGRTASAEVRHRRVDRLLSACVPSWSRSAEPSRSNHRRRRDRAEVGRSLRDLQLHGRDVCCWPPTTCRAWPDSLATGRRARGDFGGLRVERGLRGSRCFGPGKHHEVVSSALVRRRSRDRVVGLGELQAVRDARGASCGRCRVEVVHERQQCASAALYSAAPATGD